jgi:AcrR family transcriptional regulator
MNIRTTEANATKQEIMLRAEQLFAQRGYESVSMREIAEACDITKANIYYYFKDKESLYLHVLESDMLEMIEALNRAAEREGTARDKIARMAETFMWHLHGKPALIRMGMRPFGEQEPDILGLVQRHRQELLRPVERVLEDGMRSGELRLLNIPVTALSFMIILRVLVSMASKWLPPPEISESDLALHTVELLFDGIRAR